MKSEYPTLLIEIEHFKRQSATDDYLVAFSGGLDSTVLLHLLAEDPECLTRLNALYIDHQIQVPSADWGVHCATVCKQWSLPFRVVKVNLRAATRQGIEALAREARYQALHAALTPNQVLLTAHHQRDQTETFLLNLSRGSGVAGLAAMPYQKTITLTRPSQSDGQIDGQHQYENRHIRPLLRVPYSELVAYAKQHQLEWVEDPSNQDTHHQRNFIRNKLLPQFEQAWPLIQQQIERTSSHQAEALTLLKRLAEQDLNAGEFTEYSISLSSYHFLDWTSFKNVLRYWASSFLKVQLSFDQIAWVKLYGVGESGSSASLKLREGSLRLYRNVLYYVSDLLGEYKINFSDLTPDARSTFQQKSVREFEVVLPLSWLEERVDDLSVRNIMADDKVNRKRLKNWFQQQDVPPWQRPLWPVVCLQGRAFILWGAAGFFDGECAKRLQDELSLCNSAEQKVHYTLTELNIISFSDRHD